MNHKSQINSGDGAKKYAFSGNFPSKFAINLNEATSNSLKPFANGHLRKCNKEGSSGNMKQIN